MTWWQAEGWPSAAEWQAVWAFLTLGVAVVAGIVAYSQLRDYRRVRNEETRPYVVIDLEFRQSFVLLEIRNVGRTAAKSVIVQFSPSLVSTLPGRTEALDRAFDSSRPISMLAPGRAMRFLLDRAPNALGNSSIPDQYIATASYKDLPPGNKSYGDGESMVLDLRQYAEAMVDQKGIAELVSAIDKSTRAVSNLKR